VARRSLALAALAFPLALVAAGCGGSAQRPASHKAQGTTLKLTVTRIGSLPQAISKAASVALPGGRMMILGGYTGSVSVDTILAGLPAQLTVVGHLPQPTHDAAAAVVQGSVYLYGGGSSISTPDVVRVSLTGAATPAPPLGEPLSDLGAVTLGGHAYLVGGWTGTEYATAILRNGTDVVARLPGEGTRYAGVAVSGRTIYVAGGLTPSGSSNAVYAFTGHKVKRIGTLPKPVAHAALAALGTTLYLVGGRHVIGFDLKTGETKLAATLPASLTDPSVVVLAGRIIVAGGGTNGVWALSPKG
jgi:hypothetical protein